MPLRQKCVDWLAWSSSAGRSWMTCCRKNETPSESISVLRFPQSGTLELYSQAYNKQSVKLNFHMCHVNKTPFASRRGTCPSPNADSALASLWASFAEYLLHHAPRTSWSLDEDRGSLMHITDSCGR
ncbi:hypothetical protein F751_4671 [Auxenochlorella protothecoides]|uniref:Uncharacterized protein n=1 Tax=Auxenochlorella protothecoides TaxID=3075 RepID=A0A087SKC4_AUXPR|nr:hypothetical protein F751_4671 [Auxenochlorella protothecoides]KFM26178.1 hypothetical protein F751_4671 [Auxenochlorella protothecoides]